MTILKVLLMNGKTKLHIFVDIYLGNILTSKEFVLSKLKCYTDYFSP